MPSSPKRGRRTVTFLASWAAVAPRRVLAEIEAKRRILDDYERYAAKRRRAMNGWDPELRNPSPIVRFLALPYADRPGYRP